MSPAVVTFTSPFSDDNSACSCTLPLAASTLTPPWPFTSLFSVVFLPASNSTLPVVVVILPPTVKSFTVFKITSLVAVMFFVVISDEYIPNEYLPTFNSMFAPEIFADWLNSPAVVALRFPFASIFPATTIFCAVTSTFVCVVMVLAKVALPPPALMVKLPLLTAPFTIIPCD